MVFTEVFEIRALLRLLPPAPFCKLSPNSSATHAELREREAPGNRKAPNAAAPPVLNQPKLQKRPEAISHFGLKDALTFQIGSSGRKNYFWKKNQLLQELKIAQCLRTSSFCEIFWQRIPSYRYISSPCPQTHSRMFCSFKLCGYLQMLHPVRQRWKALTRSPNSIFISNSASLLHIKRLGYTYNKCLLTCFLVLFLVFSRLTPVTT